MAQNAIKGELPVSLVRLFRRLETLSPICMCIVVRCVRVVVHYFRKVHSVVARAGHYYLIITLLYHPVLFVFRVIRRILIHEPVTRPFIAPSRISLSPPHPHHTISSCQALLLIFNSCRVHAMCVGFVCDLASFPTYHCYLLRPALSSVLCYLY